MPTQSTRRASRAVRKKTTPVARNASGAASRKYPCAPVRSWNAYPGAGPIVDPEELAELRRAHNETKRELLQLKRDITWNRVIDDAIHLCRVLCKAELAELDAKYRADQPRVPAGNPDGGQWVDDGGGGARAGVAGTAPAGASIEIDDVARRAAQAAAKLRQLLQAGGQIVTASGTGTSALAVGILMATADPTGGARQEQTQTLADGTIVTVSSHPGDTPDRTIRAESPDGTVTYATISIGNGSVKVLGGEVQSPGGGRQPIDPNAFAAAAGALINAATGGGGGKTKPGSPDKSGLAATPPPDDEEDPNQRTLAASDRKLRLLERHGDEAIYSFDGAAGEAQVIFRATRQGDTIYLRGVHIQGRATLKESLEAAKQFGRQQGARRVIIEPGKRTTGANPGHVPRPITIETGL